MVTLAMVEIYDIKKENEEIFAYLVFSGYEGIEELEEKSRIIRVEIDEEGYVKDNGRKILIEIKDIVVYVIERSIEEGGGIKAIKEFIETASDLAEEKALIEDLKNNGLMNFVIPGTAELIAFANALIEGIQQNSVNIFYLIACQRVKTVPTYELERFYRNTNKSIEDIKFLEEINKGLSNDTKYVIENVEYERAEIALRLRDRWMNILK